jgi:alpha-L-fucosidase
MMNVRTPLSLLVASALLGALLSPATSAKTAPPAPLSPVPSAAQLRWQEDELTMFVHFGMNTFTGRSTGLGSEDPKLFDPTELDCAQWVRAAKEAGFKGMILTAKHHDGFCLWPTKTTEHSLKHSPWKNGGGDVVREFTDACHTAGMKAGIYCSPWDRSQPNYDTDKAAYAKLYRIQLTELLSNYGPVYEMWFDGNKANVADWPNVINVVHTLQPDAIIKQGPRVNPITEDVRWVGNEEASAPLASWSVYPTPDTKATDQERIWFPVECDTMMVGHWFWDDQPPRSLATLLNYYYTSVGRNSILMLNVAPDRRGKFSDASIARMQEFRAALDSIFGRDFAKGHVATATNVRGNDTAFGAAAAVDGDKTTYWATDDGVTSASLEIDLGAEAEFNVIRLEEMIGLGQRVQRYRVEVPDGSSWRTIAQGSTIGYRKLDRIPKTKAAKVRLTILEARACPTIRGFGLHLDIVSPAEYFEPAKANAEYSRKK